MFVVKANVRALEKYVLPRVHDVGVGLETSGGWHCAMLRELAGRVSAL